MKLTQQSNIGWMILNGSGWNHHRTADALLDAKTPDVPRGYAVCVAPISDKPFGLRCALVRLLPRKMEPSINIHFAAGNYDFAGGKAILATLADDAGVEACRAHLISNGYHPSPLRPDGWPDGLEWFRAQNGAWASIEMLDDGCDAEESGWVYERFGCDGEIVKSVKAEQQSDDDSAFFAKSMAEAIAQIHNPPTVNQ